MARTATASTDCAHRWSNGDWTDAAKLPKRNPMTGSIHHAPCAAMSRAVQP